MEKPVYHRVLLKISGEALAGDKHSGLDFEVIGQMCIRDRPRTAAAAKWSGPVPITSVCWLRS